MALIISLYQLNTLLHLANIANIVHSSIAIVVERYGAGEVRSAFKKRLDQEANWEDCGGYGGRGRYRGD